MGGTWGEENGFGDRCMTEKEKGKWTKKRNGSKWKGQVYEQ